MSSVVLLPTVPEPPPPAAPISLADLEREVASRLGPFYDLIATGGTSNAVTVSGLRSNATVGGYEGLYLLRRGAIRENDRVRTVERFDGPSGMFLVDFPYEDTPIAGERFELHHLHPDMQLFVDVQAGLRRCWLLDTLYVLPPPDVAAAAGGYARIYEVGPGSGGNGNGWVVFNGGPGTLGPLAPPVLSQMAGVTDRSGNPSGPVAVVDLTEQAFWLAAARQVLAVTSQGAALAACGRYGDPSADGWTCYAARGHVYLGIPAGIPLDGLTVRAYRDAYGLVNGVDEPNGPRLDTDEVAVPIDYAAAFAHIEAWRRHRDRLEAAAAEGRFASQSEASTEATRVAAQHADWLFRPQTERGDTIASPWGSGAKPSPSGLGGSGALAGAVVNQNDPYR